MPLSFIGDPFRHRRKGEANSEFWAQRVELFVEGDDRLTYVILREQARELLAIQMGIRQGRRAADPILFPDHSFDWLRARGWKIIE